MIESDDSGNRMRTAGHGAVAVIDGPWGDIRQLAVSHLLSPEETETMILLIKEMRNLDQRLAGDSGPQVFGSRLNSSATSTKERLESFSRPGAGHYRDRNVTVGKHKPPAYYEVPMLMRRYCDDIEHRLSAIDLKPQITDVLLETLAGSAACGAGARTGGRKKTRLQFTSIYTILFLYARPPRRGRSAPRAWPGGAILSISISTGKPTP